jgi:hypothetical protein
MKTMLSVIMLAGTLLAVVHVGCSGQELESGKGTLRVLVVSEANVPLAGAKVISNTQPEGQLKVTGSTGADGLAVYEGIKSGRYEFYVSRFDYEQKDFSAEIAAGRDTEVTVTLTAASDRSAGG